jgi:hypothetical protein
MQATKLRLLVTDQCNRNCAGCCNKDWDLKKLPVVTDDLVGEWLFDRWDEIIFTGGEPLLDPVDLCKIMCYFYEMFDAKSYLYTADPFELLVSWHEVITWLDGITLTIHDADAAKDFKFLNKYLLCLKKGGRLRNLSLRLHSFVPEANWTFTDLSLWKFKQVKWIENCPLPDGEVFMRLEYNYTI